MASASSRYDPNLLKPLQDGSRLSDPDGSGHDSRSSGAAQFPEDSVDRLVSALLDSPTTRRPLNGGEFLPHGIYVGPVGQTRRVINKKALKEMLDAVGCENEINVHDDYTPASSLIGDYPFAGNVNTNDPENNRGDNPAANVNVDNPSRNVNTDGSPTSKPAFSASTSNFTSANLFARRPVPNPALPGNGRKSPTIPRKSSRRALQDNFRKGLSPLMKTSLVKSKTGALTPQHVHSSRWNTARGQKVSDSFRGLTDSKTTALAGFDASPTSPINVSKKIEAMLAQTQALKPSPKPDTRMSRMSSRLTIKVSGAWDRILGKKQAKNAGRRLEISRPLELTQASSHFNPTIRMVDDISGIHQGMSFPTMTTSPSVENYNAPVPQTPQNRYSLADSSVNVSIADPFVDDTQFSDDLDDILNDCPLAASTPRAPRRPTQMPENSPLYQKALAVGKNGSGVEEDAPLGGFSQLERAVASNSLQLPRQDLLTKKYPTPSAQDLEVLTNQLQLLGVRPKEDEADELAYSGNDEEKAEAGSEVAELQIKTPPQPGKTRIPGPLGSSRSTLRFGLCKVPLGVDSSEVDELA
ncbi:hypothetical protein F5X68DRAFT_238445 [Plectosphaerella plurivora]|uniref:Uncharacterized protein n=1 Tax=Plectosphaerella plurivora TaxID=936078 RepID=A0A9P8VP09_9PEZI|nr:hypothetical protein F5X68DRAFT_238445 [Plectosphaerella plurivora]